MGQAEAAKRILKNYFYNISIAAGLRWNYENDGDIDVAVDDIIKTVLETINQNKTEE